MKAAAIFGASAMLCDTCRYSERPGFVRHDLAPRAASADATAAADFVPCPDLVLEIRIHNRAFFVFDQLNEVSQSRSPGRFGTNEGATTMQS